ncbi:unnamed protein product [Protopolystoma xenopodis]|uniref:Uncharacterized protein n=1 Tax=Protopolystoma xenopodis TaxID=117903 RepID=A0A448XJD5_9PLAT|nr:unnamed protein product [Protopolystoma xenopodis]
MPLLPFRAEVLREEIRRSVPPEDDWQIHDDAVSEAISFYSGENVRHMTDIIRRSLLPFRAEVLREEIRRSVPPEDDWQIHDDAVSEAISFDSGENVSSFRPSYDGHHQAKVSSSQQK